MENELLGERNPTWWQYLDCIPSSRQETIHQLAVLGHTEWNHEIFSGFCILVERWFRQPDPSWCQMALGTWWFFCFHICSPYKANAQCTERCSRRGCSLEMVFWEAELRTEWPDFVIYEKGEIFPSVIQRAPFFGFWHLASLQEPPNKM